MQGELNKSVVRKDGYKQKINGEWFTFYEVIVSEKGDDKVFVFDNFNDQQDFYAAINK